MKEAKQDPSATISRYAMLHSELRTYYTLYVQLLDSLDFAYNQLDSDVLWFVHYEVVYIYSIPNHRFAFFFSGPSSSSSLISA